MTVPQIEAPVVRSDTYDPGRYFPDVRDVTFRDGITRDEIVAVLQYWIKERLVPFLNTQVELIDGGRQNSNDLLVAAVNAALQSQATAVNAAVAQLGSGQVALNDSVVAAIVQAAGSTTRSKLDGLYKFTQDTLYQAFQDTTSGTWGLLRDYNDARYRRAQQAGKKNSITGWFHVTDFGATPSNADEDNDGIQAAINAANAEYLLTGSVQRVFCTPGTYLIGVRQFTQTSTNAQEACGVELKNGVELYGPSATFQVKNNAYGTGAFFAIVRSQYAGLIDAGIRGITFDGNRGAQIDTGQNSGNILLEARRNVWVREVGSRDSNGNGIMVRGNAYGDFAENVVIDACFVRRVSGIGIQTAQFDGLAITNNVVRDCSDNGIDIYGEYANHSTTAHGVNFQVNDNQVSTCRVGIFLETVAYGLALGNRISKCTESGFRTNRINGAPTSISIKSNGVFFCPIGLAFSGDMDAVSFTDNEVQGASTAAVQFDGLRCSGVFGDGNLLNTTADNVPLILVTNYVQQFTQVFIDRTMTKKSTVPTFTNYAQSSSASTIATAHGPGF